MCALVPVHTSSGIWSRCLDVQAWQDGGRGRGGWPWQHAGVSYGAVGFARRTRPGKGQEKGRPDLHRAWALWSRPSRGVPCSRPHWPTPRPEGAGRAQALQDLTCMQREALKPKHFIGCAKTSLRGVSTASCLGKPNTRALWRLAQPWRVQSRGP